MTSPTKPKLGPNPFKQWAKDINIKCPTLKERQAALDALNLPNTITLNGNQDWTRGKKTDFNTSLINVAHPLTGEEYMLCYGKTWGENEGRKELYWENQGFTREGHLFARYKKINEKWTIVSIGSSGYKEIPVLTQ